MAAGRASGSRWYPNPRPSRTGSTSTSTPAAGRAVPIETRRQRVGAEARRLSGLGATMVGVFAEEGIDHYAVAMKDPEGNEFDIN
jgi:glyoxalase superfamily protein